MAAEVNGKQAAFSVMLFARHLLVLLSLAAQSACAQTASSTDIESPSYLLRLERVRDKNGVCVLLRGDGQYHLEQDTAERTTVVEGTLDEGTLRDIFHIASGDQLFDLKQSQISLKAIRSEQDRVILEIHRPGYWQLLLFPDSAARAPYWHSMGPLLKWADGLLTLKSSRIFRESFRNNCDPVDTPNLKQRNEDPTYIVRMLDDRFEGGGINHTCVIIFTSGTFHLVKQFRKFDSKEVSSAILDGFVSHADLRSLRDILDSPVFRKLPGGQPPPKAMPISQIGNLLLTEVFIPRKGSIQRVWNFWKTNGSVMDSVEDHGTNLLYPLRERLMLIASGDRAVPAAYPRNARCVPEK